MTETPTTQTDKGQGTARRPDSAGDSLQKREMVFIPDEGVSEGASGRKDQLRRSAVRRPQTATEDPFGETSLLDSLLGTSMVHPDTARHAAIMSDPRFAHSANCEPRSRITNRLQATYGNGHVQRVVALSQSSSYIQEPMISRSMISNAIQRDVPLSTRRISGADADREIRRYFAFHMQQMARDVSALPSAAGNISVVDDAVFRREYEREYATAEDRAAHPYAGINAFVDAQSHAWVHEDRGTVGTIIHESLHMYSNPELLESRIGRAGKEGMTEYFTEQVCRQMGIDRDYAEYREATDAVRRLAGVVDDYWVRNAFFRGQLTALGHQLDDRRGAWGAFFLWSLGMRNGQVSLANRVLEMDPGQIRQHATREREEEAAVQRQAAPGADMAGSPVSDDVEQKIQSKQGSGQPLEKQTRRRMEDAFGHDFGGVNIHTDHTADHLAKALQAKAFTVGNDVFFRSGAYAPASNDGQQLLGHELTHVVQQNPQRTSVQRTCDEACRRRAGVLARQLHTLFGTTRITDPVRRRAYSTFGADELNADLAGEIVRQYDALWSQPGFVEDFMTFVGRVVEQGTRHPGQSVEAAVNQLIEVWAADFYDAGIIAIQARYPVPRTIPFTQANLSRWRTQLVPGRYSGSGDGSQLNIAPLVMWVAGFRWQTLQGGYEWIQRLGWMPSFNSSRLLPCIQMLSAQPELHRGGIRETDAYFTDIWSRYTQALDDGRGENGRGTRNMIASYQIHRDYAHTNMGQVRPVSAALAQKIEDWYYILGQGGGALPDTRDVAKPVNRWVPAWHELLGRWRANDSIDQDLRRRAGIATPTGNNPMLQIPGAQEFFGG